MNVSNILRANNNGKTIKLIYWTSTSLIAVMMLFSAYQYFMSDELIAAFQHLGFPGYFRVELGVAKIIGAIVLLVPGINQAKELAYAGFGITFISAIIAHASVGDSVQTMIPPVIAMLLLISSHVTSRTLRH